MDTGERPIPIRLSAEEAEEWDLKLFRNLELSPEEFAARHGHEFAMFNFHTRTYKTPGMNEWIRQLAELFFAPDLPARLKKLRAKYLTADEIRGVEEYERAPF